MACTDSSFVHPCNAPFGPDTGPDLGPDTEPGREGVTERAGPGQNRTRLLKAHCCLVHHSLVGAPRRQTELLRLVRAAGCCPDALTLRMAVGQCLGNAAQWGEHRSAHKVQLMGLGPQGGDWRLQEPLVAGPCDAQIFALSARFFGSCSGAAQGLQLS